jgi:hypothetical protein
VASRLRGPNSVFTNSTGPLGVIGGGGHRNAITPGVIMLVKLEDQKEGRNRLSIICFLLITVVPWIVMIWLLWPVIRQVPH